MTEVSAPSRPDRSDVAVALLGIGAALAIAAYLLLPEGRRLAIGSEVLAVITCFVAAGVIFASGRGRAAWPSAGYLGWTLVLLGLGDLLFLAIDLAHHGNYRPRATDFFFLLILVPVAGAARIEYEDHFGDRDRREVEVDVALITASLAAIAYVLIRPFGAGVQISLSAVTFALLAAAPVTAFGALALWVPSRAHLVQFLIFLVFSAATLVFGYLWVQGLFQGTLAFLDLAFILCPLALAALVSWGPRSREPVPERAPV